MIDSFTNYYPKYNKHFGIVYKMPHACAVCTKCCEKCKNNVIDRCVKNWCCLTFAETHCDDNTFIYLYIYFFLNANRSSSAQSHSPSLVCWQPTVEIRTLWTHFYIISDFINNFFFRPVILSFYPPFLFYRCIDVCDPENRSLGFPPLLYLS